MIKEAIENWYKNKHLIEQELAAKHVENYKSLVEIVIRHIADEQYEDFDPDCGRIHEIDDGDYQGTLVFVVAAKGYQPSDYWYVKVSYGSCSGCDTLQRISEYSDEKPTEQQTKDYMMLALHIVQGLKKLGAESV